MNNFGQNLKKYRKQMNLSQSALAKLVAVGQTSIANYEKNLRFPNQDILVKLSETLSVSVDLLLNKETTDTLVKTPIDSPESFIELLIENKKDEAFERIKSNIKCSEEVLDFYYGFLTEALHRVGLMWQQGEISIAKEHYITHAIEELLFVLRPLMNQSNQRSKKVLLMVPSFEKHLLAIKIVKEHFIELGWQTFFIGQSVPWSSLIQAIENEKVDLVCISVTMSDNYNDLKALLDFIKSKSKIKILLGGQAFVNNPDYINLLEPDFYGQTKFDLVKIDTYFSK
jgi:methanogenic corrinoid protein MtbC1